MKQVSKWARTKCSPLLYWQVGAKCSLIELQNVLVTQDGADREASF